MTDDTATCDILIDMRRGFFWVENAWFSRGLMKAHGLTPTDFTVYCCLVSHANAETSVCFPTRDTIAAECGCSVRAVTDSIAALATARLLSVERVSSPRKGTHNVYGLASFADPAPNLESGRVKCATDAGTNVHQLHVTRARRIGLNNTHVNNDGGSDETTTPETPPRTTTKPTRRTAYDPAFDETFWRLYPKTLDVKAHAYREWANLSAEDRARLPAAIASWKQSREWQSGAVVYPTRWLRDRRFEIVVEPYNAQSNGNGAGNGANGLVACPGVGMIDPRLADRIAVWRASFGTHRKPPDGYFPDAIQTDLDAFRATHPEVMRA